MGWWKADPAPREDSPTIPPRVPPRPSPPAIPLSPPKVDPPSACPVDHKTRSTWLQQQTPPQLQGPTLPPSHPPIPVDSVPPLASSSTSQCSSETISHTAPPPSSTSSSTPKGFHPLSHDRVISSIPRANPTSTHSLPPATASPSNSESETGQDASTGNWVYPSEHQFFTAVLRKHSLPSSAPSTDSLVGTIPSIISIHNAVNERAWSIIKQWEGNRSAACGGPKLLSFRGLGAGPEEAEGAWGGMMGYARLLDPRTSLSPRARIKALGGYQTPFDRHDWVVERCGGEKVEYVIDFYQGKSTTGNDKRGLGGELNFYLDVRPKLNSWEGWRMRGAKLFGVDDSINK